MTYNIQFAFSLEEMIEFLRKFYRVELELRKFTKYGNSKYDEDEERLPIYVMYEFHNNNEIKCIDESDYAYKLSLLKEYFTKHLKEKLLS